MDGTASILQSALIHNNTGPFETKHIFLFAAPTIRSLSLARLTFSDTWTPELFGNFNALEELDIDDYDDVDNEGWEKFVSTLALLPNLMRLRLSEFSIEATGSIASSCLPRLIHVSFSHMPADSVDSFFLQCTAPELASVHVAWLSDSQFDEGSFPEVFSPIFFKQRFPQLHHLLVDISDLGLFRDILCVSFAQRITFEDRRRNSNEDYLGDLVECVLDGGGCLCPSLRAVEVSARTVRPETPRRLVESRSQASQRNPKNPELGPTSSAIQSLRLSDALSAGWRGDDKQWLIDHVPDCVFEE